MRLTLTRILLLLGLTLAVFEGCQKLGALRPSARAEPEAYLRGADEALRMRDSAKAIHLYQEFLGAYPDHDMAEQAALRLAWVYLESRDPSRACPLLREWLDRYPKSRQNAKARLYLGICLFQTGNPKEALGFLHPLTEDPAAATLQPQVHAYLGESYLQLKQLLPALTWYARYDAGLSEEAERKIVQRKFVGIAGQGWDEDVLQRALTLFPDGFIADVVRYGIALAYFNSGRMRLSEEILLRMSSRHLDDPLTPNIQDLLHRIYEKERPRQCTIGCLLPLSGKYEQFGAGVLDALLLGARAFNSSGSQGRPIRLLVRDTQGDPAVGVSQLKELAADPGLVGIVGPLTAEEGLACAREAQVLGVPMIALTQREEVAKVGDFVFQNGLTIRQQVEALVDYAMGELGVIRFAVLYPNDAYGTLARARFREKVVAMGGEVVASVPYAEKETDFQDELRLLVGDAYWLAVKERDRKKGFLATLEDDEAEEETSPAASSRAGSDAIPLPFEALFIPDWYREVSLIAPHLALYDLSGILLLGTNAWNSMRLVEAAGEYVKGSVFVDGFFADSPMPFVRDFVEEFRRAFQRDPGLLDSEALDSLWMLETAFDQAEEKTRVGVRDALSAMEDYPGLSGSTGFDGSGCARKALYLLSISGNRIQQIY